MMGRKNPALTQNFRMYKSPFHSAIFLLLLTAPFFFTTCKKEYSYEGGKGTAAYSLTDSNGACIGNIVNGEYYTGKALDQSNTIEVKVNVTTVGTYSVRTNSVNGIYFSASGTFLNTGINTIVITGSGIPESDGTFTFTTPVDPNCSFSVTVNKPPPTSFTLTGSPGGCVNAVVDGDYIIGVALSSSNRVTLSINVNVPGSYTIHTDTLDGISFSNSGVFTNTGNQTITLTGSGTPIEPKNLSFTPVAGASACTFPVSVRNREPLATYVLESGSGTPGPCVYSVAGIYTLNTPLSSANTVSVRVYVTLIGNFTIATNTVNGMTFSYTGAFTTTGTQYVTLTGSGTPSTAGTSSFIPEIVGPHPIGGSSCGFDVEVQ